MLVLIAKARGSVRQSRLERSNAILQSTEPFNGPLSDLGAHEIDIFNWWLGSPKSVIGSGGDRHYKNHDWATTPS